MSTSSLIVFLIKGKGQPPPTLNIIGLSEFSTRKCSGNYDVWGQVIKDITASTLLGLDHSPKEKPATMAVGHSRGPTEKSMHEELKPPANS